MIRHRFEVIIDVDDDDQTDPEEFLAGHLKEVLDRRFAKENEEYGTEWPNHLQVKFLRTTYMYKAPAEEEANGTSDEDRGSKKEG